MADASAMSKSADRPLATKPEQVCTPRVISIVDDDKSFREAMARLMRSLGHSVAAFDSAEGFLRSDRVNETDCLICDVRMPRMSGIDLQKHLIAKRQRVPIIFVTAHPTEGAREDALAAGAIGFLRKPCNEETLIGLLDQALRGRSATK
jgi:FixJ family two-component response regulator